MAVASCFDFDHAVKLTLMGESGVGKTCIMDRWTENVWRGEGACSSTFGVDFSQRVVQVNEQLMKARIWDASGKVSQRRFFSPFYRHSHGIILVYDITNKGTLEKLEDWLSSVVPLANSNATIMLVGCKADLESARQVSVEDARTFCAAHKVRLMAEVSCATGAGVDAAFQMLLSRIQHRLVEDSEAASTLSEGAVQVLQADHEAKPAYTRASPENYRVL